jgi:hypothetical protein
MVTYKLELKTGFLFQILEWDDYYRLPETLTMDGRRIVALRDQVEFNRSEKVASFYDMFFFNVLVKTRK